MIWGYPCFWKHLPIWAWNHHMADSWNRVLGILVDTSISKMYHRISVFANLLCCGRGPNNLCITTCVYKFLDTGSTYLWFILILWSLNVGLVIIYCHIKMNDLGFTYHLHIIWHIIAQRLMPLYAQKYIMYILGPAKTVVHSASWRLIKGPY